jgi:F-type H+-transporting ATPase subunit a
MLNINRIYLQIITNRKKILLNLVLCLVILLPLNTIAQEAEHADSTKTEETFSPGEFILEHIGDAYEWHIAKFGETHVSIPLPVILFSKTKGLHIFLSSKFHHGLETYNGFKISEEESNKGKIVEITADNKEIRPIDISITKNVLQLFILVALVLGIFLSISRKYVNSPGKAPSGIQSLLEPLILFVRDDIARSSLGEKKYEKYLPYLLTIFFFIFLGNLIGLIPIFPGGANLTGNIAITMVLALFTFVITTFIANMNYWKHIINAPGVPWWLKIPLPLMPIVELIGVFTKPFVLMVRLFANITAGHIIALGFFSLIFVFGNMNIFAGYGISILSIAFTIFMTMLELLVAFIQAYVFTLLSALYFGMATEEPHAKHNKH